MLSQFSPETVLRGCNPTDVLRYYPFSRLLCHLGNSTPAERARVEAGVPSALLEVLHTCKLDREMMRRLDERNVRASAMERARRRRRRDELVDVLLRELSPAEVLRRYSVDQLVSHLRERAAAEGTLPDVTIDALREYMDGTL